MRSCEPISAAPRSATRAAALSRSPNNNVSKKVYRKWKSKIARREANFLRAEAPIRPISNRSVAALTAPRAPLAAQILRLSHCRAPARTQLTQPPRPCLRASLAAALPETSAKGHSLVSAVSSRTPCASATLLRAYGMRPPSSPPPSAAGQSDAMGSSTGWHTEAAHRASTDLQALSSWQRA